jgi:hypothetical protein
MIDPSRDRARTWWEDLHDGVEAAEAHDLPDPWADADEDGDDPGLTPDQQAFLAGLEDQPSIPRLTGIEADE